MITSAKGQIAETLVLHELTKRGFNVSIPFGDYRYDLIAEKNGKFNRIQVKYVGNLTKRSTIPVVLHSISRKGRIQYKEDEIDFIAVYCKPLENFYIIPFKDVAGKTAVNLRVKPANNNQAEKIIYSENFENRWDLLNK
jgi:hypothetical protein